mmetsp:Transcript_22962/g.19924  ORF Transcript_22962/g.19924 Transcript_22962/m.19924 type:complete len:187 (+) Transcript_22962:573-1133(+)
MYPRLKIYGCTNRTGSDVVCAAPEDIQWTIMTGRLFIYLKEYGQIDYTTGEFIGDDQDYTAYYYFLVWDLYLRAEMKIINEDVTIEPDLFNHLSTRYMSRLNLEDQVAYVSRTPNNVSRSMFSWWCTMDPNTIKTTVVFTTTLDMMSKWGAMWSLLFGVFALYFLRYNQNMYFKEKPHMKNFDDKI